MLPEAQIRLADYQEDMLSEAVIIANRINTVAAHLVVKNPYDFTVVDFQDLQRLTQLAMTMCESLSSQCNHLARITSSPKAPSLVRSHA